MVSVVVVVVVMAVVVVVSSMIAVVLVVLVVDLKSDLNLENYLNAPCAFIVVAGMFVVNSFAVDWRCWASSLPTLFIRTTLQDQTKSYRTYCKAQSAAIQTSRSCLKVLPTGTGQSHPCHTQKSSRLDGSGLKMCPYKNSIQHHSPDFSVRTDASRGSAPLCNWSI